MDQAHEDDPLWGTRFQDYQTFYMPGMLDSINAARQKLVPGATPFRAMPVPAATQVRRPDTGAVVAGQGGAAQEWVESLARTGVLVGLGVHQNDAARMSAYAATAPVVTPGCHWASRAEGFVRGTVLKYDPTSEDEGTLVALLATSPEHVAQFTDTATTPIYALYGAMVTPGGRAYMVLQTYTEVC